MKVIILDKNVEYAERLKRFVELKHPMIQLLICDNKEAAIKTSEKEKCDVFLADVVFADELAESIPEIEKDAAFSFISDTDEILKDREAFGKFMRVEEMYGKICSLYETKKNRILQTHAKDEEKNKNAKVITFFPVSGGTGSSTLAAVCAIALSRTAKVLYLNLEQLSSESVFFDGPGKKGISDLIALLKSKFSEADLYNQLKELFISDEKQGSDNLQFIRGYRTANDCASMAPNFIEVLIRQLREKFDFKYIVIDTGFIAGKVFDQIVMNSNQLVFVSNGSDIANEKLRRIRRYVEVIGRESKTAMPAENIAFNQYYGIKDEELVTRDMRVLLRVPRYRTDEKEHIASQVVVNAILSRGDVFGELR